MIPPAPSPLSLPLLSTHPQQSNALAEATLKNSKDSLANEQKVLKGLKKGFDEVSCGIVFTQVQLLLLCVPHRLCVTWSYHMTMPTLHHQVIWPCTHLTIYYSITMPASTFCAKITDVCVHTKWHFKSCVFFFSSCCVCLIFQHWVLRGCDAKYHVVVGAVVMVLTCLCFSCACQQ